MSNECSTILTVTPDTPAASATLNSFREIAFKRYGRNQYLLDLESLLPNPFKNMSKGIAIDRSAKWYHENWGTTEPCCLREIESSDDKYTAGFLPNSSPPFNAFMKISGDYPELTFEIDCWGFEGEYCGTYAYRNGECVLGDELF